MNKSNDNFTAVIEVAVKLISILPIDHRSQLFTSECVSLNLHSLPSLIVEMLVAAVFFMDYSLVWFLPAVGVQSEVKAVYESQFLELLPNQSVVLAP